MPAFNSSLTTLMKMSRHLILISKTRRVKSSADMASIHNSFITLGVGGVSSINFRLGYS